MLVAALGSLPLVDKVLRRFWSEALSLWSLEPKNSMALAAAAIGACEAGAQWALALHILKQMSSVDVMAVTSAMSACAKGLKN